MLFFLSRSPCFTIYLGRESLLADSRCIDHGRFGFGLGLECDPLTLSGFRSSCERYLHSPVAWDWRLLLTPQCLHISGIPRHLQPTAACHRYAMPGLIVSVPEYPHGLITHSALKFPQAELGFICLEQPPTSATQRGSIMLDCLADSVQWKPHAEEK